QILQAGDLLGDKDGVAEGGDQDAGGELDALRAAGGKGQGLKRRQPGGAVEPARGQQVLDDPQRLVSHRLGAPREVAQPRRLCVVQIWKRKTRQCQPEPHQLDPPQYCGRELNSPPSPARETAMTEFSYDHVHLRSPNPDETAAYYERMFGAEVIKSIQSDGRERVDMRLGGVMMFIAKVDPDAELAEKPAGRYVGLDHLGLRVRNID